MHNTPYIYLFIREDLSIPQQIVQTAHAVDELGKRIDNSSKTNHMVLFSVRDEYALSNIAEYLKEHKVLYEMFYEPDIEAFTAIATRPLIGNERSIMSKFKLKK